MFKLKTLLNPKKIFIIGVVTAVAAFIDINFIATDTPAYRATVAFVTGNKQIESYLGSVETYAPVGAHLSTRGSSEYSDFDLDLKGSLKKGKLNVKAKKLMRDWEISDAKLTVDGIEYSINVSPQQTPVMLIITPTTQP